MKIFCDAPQRIAGETAIGSVLIDDLHPGVRFVRRIDQYDTVAADAQMSVGKHHRQAFRIVDMLIKTIEIDVIVLRSAELHKLEYLTLFSHLIDIYQLGTFFRKFGTETPDKGFRRIHGSQTRNRSLYRFPSDLDGIFRRNSSS